MKMHQALEIVLYRKNNKSRTQSYSVHSANKTNWVPNIKKKNPKVLEKKIKQVCLHSYLSRTTMASKAGETEALHRVLMPPMAEDNGESFQSFKGKLYF